VTLSHCEQGSKCTAVGLILSNWLEVLFILFMLGILVLHSQVLHTALLILLVLLALRELFQLRSAFLLTFYPIEHCPLNPIITFKGQTWPEILQYLLHVPR
jgi:hypothetical protein